MFSQFDTNVAKRVPHKLVQAILELDQVTLLRVQTRTIHGTPRGWTVLFTQPLPIALALLLPGILEIRRRMFVEQSLLEVPWLNNAVHSRSFRVGARGMSLPSVVSNLADFLFFSCNKGLLWNTDN